MQYVNHVTKRGRSQMSRQYHGLSADALRDLRRGLHNRLHWMGLGWLSTTCQDGPDQTTTRASSNGISLDLESRPSRSLVRKVVQQWEAQAAELTRALRCDRRALVERFSEGRDPGIVTRIWPDLGDPHHGGRSTLSISFESGLTLVYKPRNERLLEAWNETFAALSDAVGAGIPRVPRLLTRPRHSWAEWLVADKQPYDDAHIARLAYRGGMMIALAYVAGASDLHRENVLMVDGWPVVVDGETLLWTEVKRGDSIDRARSGSFDLLMRDSVVRTGLISRWQQSASEARDGAGLELFAIEGNVDANRNALMEGFEHAYHVLRTQKMTATIQRFADRVSPMSVRFVYRSTAVYRRAILSFVAASADGAGLATAKRGSRALSIMEPGERLQIEDLSIPRFEARAGLVGGLDVPTDPGRSGACYVRRAIHRLSEHDLRRQRALLGASLTLRNPDQSTGMAVRPATIASALDAAQELGRLVRSAAIEDDHGLLWLTSRPVCSRKTWRLVPADLGLYDGNVGIALFFAALGRVVDSKWTIEASRALAPVLVALRMSGGVDEFVARYGPGMAEGVGGILFGLAALRRLDRDDVLVCGIDREFQHVDRLKRVALEQRTSRAEALYGRAGLVVGMSAMDGGANPISASETSLRHRIQCDLTRELERSMLRPGCDRRIGVAHGECGVATALALRSFVDDLQLATKALRDWLESTPFAEYFANHSWCCGAAGIAVAIDVARRVVDPPAAAPALASTLLALVSAGRDADSGMRNWDSTLCCGLAGHLAALTSLRETATEMGIDTEPSRSRISRTLVARIAGRTLGGRLAHADLWSVSCGLFRGLSGVGYSLLHSIRPDVIPGLVHLLPECEK